jgi:hypothetical protein
MGLRENQSDVAPANSTTRNRSDARREPMDPAVGWSEYRAEVRTTLENAVDLARFATTQEGPTRRLLFIRSFRHFANIASVPFLDGRSAPTGVRR